MIPNSLVEFKINENIHRVKYNNLYFYDNNFYFLTTDKNIILEEIKLLGGPEHTDQILNEEYIFLPKLKIFDTQYELNNFINKDIIIINGITNYYTHYYEHNIGHGLYDTLYPSFLTLINFFNKDDIYTNLINLLYIPGWICPLNCSRNWILNIMSKFSKSNNLIKNNLEKDKIYKFEILIAGSGYAGISSINKNGIMPGKELFALEKFRDRFYQVYNITPNIKNFNNINIIIVDSDRYSKIEKEYLLKINEELKKNYNCNYIYWKDYCNFKEQLQLLNNIDIYISACGTSMNNFPFLNKNSILINLGTNKSGEKNIKQLMEVNMCLLSNDILVDYYDIFNYNEILYNPVLEIIEKNINILKNNINNTNEKNIINTIIPNYIKIWKELCNKNIYNEQQDEKNINDLIDRMNNNLKPDLVPYRYPEILIQENFPYDTEKSFLNNVNTNLLKIIKKKYNSIL